MRDCNVVTNGTEEVAPENGIKCIYKEIVIIGNGPSGITLSYLLSGNSPFYNRKAHPDPMLSARLIECTQKSLLHQDLSFLSQGIEGRSKNPVSLLIDAMTHPGADMGLEWPSLLSWKKTNKCLDHVVLGKGQPGGTWQGIANNVMTISPGRWMSLPGFEFEYKEGRAPASAVAQYYTEYIERNGLGQFMVPNTVVTLVQPLGSSPKRRARWRVWVRDGHGSTVSYECRHLVLATGASDRAGCLGVPGEALPFVTHDLKVLEDRLNEAAAAPAEETKGEALWAPGTSKIRVLPRRDKILLKTKSNSSLLSADSKHSLENVLRSSDNIPRQIDSDQDLTRKRVYGEYEEEQLENINTMKGMDGVWGGGLDRQRNLSHTELRETDVELVYSILRHSLHELSVEKAVERRGAVLVVGAGLSAADAILTARRRGFPVVHAFRRTPVPAPLPAVMYPEYHEVYQLMQGLISSPDYRAMPGYQVAAFQEDSAVVLADQDGKTETIPIFMAAVLIGSQPDLSFLPKKLRNLGVDLNKPVDCKVNPVYVEPFSYRCVRAHSGLHALGPLVGDNFVRFLQGGAVAIASHIYKETNLHNCP